MNFYITDTGDDGHGPPSPSCRRHCAARGGPPDDYPEHPGSAGPCALLLLAVWLVEVVQMCSSTFFSDLAISGTGVVDATTFSICFFTSPTDSFTQVAYTPCVMQRESTDDSMLSKHPVAAVKALAASTTFSFPAFRAAMSFFSSATPFPRRRFSPWAEEQVRLFFVSSFWMLSSWIGRLLASAVSHSFGLGSLLAGSWVAPIHP